MAVRRIGVMDKSLGWLAVSTLAFGVAIGVLFQYVYPGTEVGAQLALLFTFLGFLLAVLLRAGWRGLRGRNQ